MANVDIRIFDCPDSLEVPEPPADGKPVAHRINFEGVRFPEYSDKYAMVIDNVFTPEDCKKLLDAAEASASWEVAKINGGPREEDQFIDTTYRNSQRIMLDDFELADWILGKLRPFLGDIEKVSGQKFALYSRKKYKDVGSAEISRFNERLRFLKYTKGQFFQRHCDGTYFTPDQTEVSYYTLQLYLNGDKDSIEGGATRFYPMRKSYDRPYLDVPPRTGRALVFQQAGLLHSGDEVVQGEKFTMRTDLMYKLVEENKEAGGWGLKWF